MVLLLENWKPHVTVTNVDDLQMDVVAEALKSEERTVLDLHASGDYQHRSKWLKMNGNTTVAPGECVRIRVRERIQLSPGVLGLVLSRVSLAADGLHVAHVKIDPQFIGQPEIAITNASQRTIPIERGLAFASLMVVPLATPMTEVLPRVVSPTRSVDLPRWRDRAARSWPFVATGLLTLAASAAPEIAKAVF